MDRFAGETGFDGNVLERTVTPVPIQMTRLTVWRADRVLNVRQNKQIKIPIAVVILERAHDAARDEIDASFSRGFLEVAMTVVQVK